MGGHLIDGQDRLGKGSMKHGSLTGKWLLGSSSLGMRISKFRLVEGGKEAEL